MTEYLPFRMWVYTVRDEYPRRGYSPEPRLERGFDYPIFPCAGVTSARQYGAGRWPGQTFHIARIVGGVIEGFKLHNEAEYHAEPSLLAELNRNLNWHGKKEDPGGQATH